VDGARSEGGRLVAGVLLEVAGDYEGGRGKRYEGRRGGEVDCERAQV